MGGPGMIGTHPKVDNGRARSLDTPCLPFQPTARLPRIFADDVSKAVELGAGHTLNVHIYNRWSMYQVPRAASPQWAAPPHAFGGLAV